MKTKITFLAAIFMIASFSSFATVLTVSNHPLGGSQYSNLNTAYNDAVNGDTLLLEGTDIPYNRPYPGQWEKSLTVIGTGFNTNKQSFKKTIINSNFRLNTGIDGSSFHGIQFSTVIEIQSNNNNLTFQDCEFTDYVNTNNTITNNLTFRNCIFSRDNQVNFYLPSAVSSTALMINCVFDGYIEGYNNALNTLIVENCLFLSTSTSNFSQVQYASISNCIFMNAFPGGTTNCTYLNNICRVAGTFPPSGNTGSGNIDNTDPGLVTYTFGELYSPAHDYHLQAGSPCSGTGTGGTDIGVHGGMSTFSEYGEALIAPVMRSVVINNTTVAPNGTLNVDISASKPTDD